MLPIRLPLHFNCTRNYDANLGRASPLKSCTGAVAVTTSLEDRPMDVLPTSLFSPSRWPAAAPDNTGVVDCLKHAAHKRPKRVDCEILAQAVDTSSTYTLCDKTAPSRRRRVSAWPSIARLSPTLQTRSIRLREYPSVGLRGNSKHQTYERNTGPT